MDAIYGVNELFLTVGDDVAAGPIAIASGFPFGSSVQTRLYVSAMCMHITRVISISLIIDRWDQMVLCLSDHPTIPLLISCFQSVDVIWWLHFGTT